MLKNLKKAQKAPKKQTEHEKNIHFAFHEFGFFGINTYRIMVFFWVFELTRAPAMLADSLYSNNSKWVNIDYSYARDLWLLSGPTPPLNYIGLFLIITALSHPHFIIKLLNKASFLKYEIQRSLSDMKSIIFSVFTTLLATRIVDLGIDLLDIAFNISSRSILLS